jgi:glycerol-3-phosphate dehydrogenase
MKKESMLQKIKANQDGFDFIIIGGGATGIGIAVEASARGYSVLLLEKSDFTKSTSSKSTKLLHGGVRYLAQGNIPLVREAVIERGLLLKNAPHLVRKQSFIIPTHNLFEEFLYTVGLTFYDLLAGRLSLGASKHISKKTAEKRMTTIKKDKISAGVVYFDCQFDDSRLAINLLQTAVELGALVVNYCQVIGLIKNPQGKLLGVQFQDEETKEEFHIQGKQIVNATGVFADDIIKLDEPSAKKMISPSQGIHLVLDKSFLPDKDAIMIPKTEDGRVLFLVPWHNKVIVGTTDTPIKKESLEPIALEEEIQFILNTTAKYFSKAPKRSDVLSVFAGLRPLAATNEGEKTKEISRSHKIIHSKSNLLTIIGGKWTTYRKMAEDLVNKAEETNHWKRTKTRSKNLKIHGYKTEVDFNHPHYYYGSDEQFIIELIKEDATMAEVISPYLQITKAQVIWAIRHEMARTVEDFLARRTRCQLLDANESLIIAPKVASIMAKELNYNDQWVLSQIKQYGETTANYII